MIRFGICTDMEYADGVKAAGYDYIELKTYDIALAKEAVFEEWRARLEALKLPCEAVNFFYPPSLKVVGPDIDRGSIFKYIGQALERAGRMGVSMITVGSSKSRMIPEGFTKERAMEQFAEQLYYAGELAGPLGITVAIEPIRPSSTNFINTIGQAAALCRLTGHPSVKIMADYYQMHGAGDGVGEVARYQELIRHLHTIEVERKCYPQNPGDKGQKALFSAYHGDRASIEGADFTTEQAARTALEALRSYAGLL